MAQKIEGVTIGIAVQDVNEAIEWYRTLLGDVEVVEPSPGTVEMKLTDDAWLQLDDSGYLQVGGGSTVIRFETKDVEAAHELVSTLVPGVETIETVEGVVKYFDFKDPSGNRLSFVQLL